MSAAFDTIAPEVAAPWADDPVLTVEHVSMRFGGLVAVNDLSFSVGRGDITALIGPNGAGKTTVFNCITGFYKPTQGMLTAEARERRQLPARAHAGLPHLRQAKVARTFQNIRLFSGMTLLENLLVAQHNALMIASGMTILGVLGVPAPISAPRRKRSSAPATGSTGPASRRGPTIPPANCPMAPSAVSRSRAPCAPARSFSVSTSPPPGLNPRESADLNALLLGIRETEKTSILLIEHDMSVVMEISDHVVVLEYGTKISDGTPLRGPQRSARHRGLSRRRRFRSREGRGTVGQRSPRRPPDELSCPERPCSRSRARRPITARSRR